MSTYLKGMGLTSGQILLLIGIIQDELIREPSQTVLSEVFGILQSRKDRIFYELVLTLEQAQALDVLVGAAARLKVEKDEPCDPDLTHLYEMLGSRLNF